MVGTVIDVVVVVMLGYLLVPVLDAKKDIPTIAATIIIIPVKINLIFIVISSLKYRSQYINKYVTH